MKQKKGQKKGIGSSSSKKQSQPKKKSQKQIKKETETGDGPKSIVDIFSQVKKEKKIQKKSKKNSKAAVKQQLEAELKKQWKKEEKMMKLGISQQDIQGRKTAEGLKLYTEDELKIGKGGNTKFCPIDCDCCF